VLSGFDWKYFVEIQKYDLRLVMTIVMMTGMFLPVFTPIILFILGCILKKTKLTITAAII
jgi:predicted metal-binding membrane protein